MKTALIAAAIAAIALAVPAAAENPVPVAPTVNIAKPAISVPLEYATERSVYVDGKDADTNETFAVNIYKVLDEETGVTCYVTNNGGISCLYLIKVLKTDK